MVTFGELSAYDPATNCGKFKLPLHRDPVTDLPIETGFIQLGTPFAGPKIGMQFPPVLDAQALVVYIDLGRVYPVAAVFMCNDVDTPPFTDGKSAGWLDGKGNFVKTTQDGSSPGDGLGGTRMGGGDYASIKVATLLELAAEGLPAGDNAVIRKKDLVTYVTNIFNNHTHTYNPGGGGPTQTGGPSASMSPAGSTKVKAAD